MTLSKYHYCDENDSSYDVIFDQDWNNSWYLWVESEYKVEIKHCPFCGVKL